MHLAIDRLPTIILDHYTIQRLGETLKMPGVPVNGGECHVCSLVDHIRPFVPQLEV